MKYLIEALSWLIDPLNWSLLGLRVAEHFWISFMACAVAALIAIPLGIYLGHTGRGRTLVVLTSSGLRALPSLGLMTGLALIGPGLRWAIVPATITLTVLAIPPILAAIYAGIGALSPEIIDAARGCGYSEWQIVTKVEIPLIAEQMVGGLRSTILQVISSATIVAYLGLGGLGRFIFDGLAVQDYPQMLVGSITVIGLALFCDLGLAKLQNQLRREHR